MQKHKGFDVPNVGGFVASEKGNLNAQYCMRATCIDEKVKVHRNCKKCLFFGLSKELIEWHEARVKEYEQNQ